MATNYNVVIEPQPGGQCLALSCPCNEVLFEGTRGSMKTATQLMKFRSYVGKGYGAFWKGVIFDVAYKNLDDIIAQSKKLFNKFDDGARFLSSNSVLKWVWPTGEELLFRYELNADGYWNYHGQEFPFIGHNELTKRADSEFYESMFSCMRSSFRPQDYPLEDGTLLPPIPLMCFSTTNPFGVGHTWVKKRFIDPVPRGTINRSSQEVPNINGGVDVVTLTRVAIHGSWKENKFLDSTYIALLMNIKDPNKKKAWVNGDWSVTSGGRFDYLWRENIHVINPFNIPSGWRVDRSHDWGESKPFSNLWFAESDGRECEINGKYAKYPKGTLFVIGEFYGCDPEEHNAGLKMSATNVAKVVKAIDYAICDSDYDMDYKFGEINYIAGIASNCVVSPGPADNAINNNDDEQVSIADKMEAQGVEWTKSDKKPGSRAAGASLLCEMLESSIEGACSESGLPERPAIYFFNNVRGIISRFPVLSRDSKKPDDVDTDQEDHDYDALRYRATKCEFDQSIELNINFSY